MTRRSLAAASLLEAKQKTPGKSILDTPRPQRPPNRLWPWLIILLVTGVILLSVVSIATWNWLHSLPITLNANTVHTEITTFKVNRTVSYADLNLNVVNAQYSTSFSDDLIHSGPAFVRLNMQVTNKTNSAISLVYYDVARLLIPKLQPIAPSNVQLVSSVQPGATVK
ncbi:MAG TPA: hypothetical protein VJO32_12075, partial [Ktedonobacteraceae bacterium]|nr:hypothetical protein [Ktedonobacteraceae bacterium]